MGGRGLDAVHDFAQQPEDGLAFLVLFFDLRLKEQVNVVGHHAGGVELILEVRVRVEDAFQNDVPLRRGELALSARGEGHHVFAPRALEMREASLGITGISAAGCFGVSREGAGNCARGGRAPRQTSNLLVEEGDAFVQCLVETLLLQLEHILHVLLAGADFGEDLAHRRGEHVHELVEERLVEAERAAVAHRAA